jgi:HSP20 family protein
MEQNMATEQSKEKQTSGETKAQSESLGRPLQPISPFALMGRLVDDLGRIMDAGFGPSFGTGRVFGPLRTMSAELSSWMPAIEVFEREGQLVIRAEVAGPDPNDVSVEIENNTLIISGQRTSDEQQEQERAIYRSERVYGSFYRAIALPEGARLDQAQASFKHGVLEITMPLEQRPEARRLPIQVQSEDKTAPQSEKSSTGQSSTESRAAGSA